MSFLTFCLGLVVGGLLEHAFDVSGRLYVLWRRWQAWRRG